MIWALPALRALTFHAEGGDLRAAASALEAFKKDRGRFPGSLDEAADYLTHWKDRSRFGHPRLYVTDGLRFLLASPGRNGRFDRLADLELPPLESELKARRCRDGEDDQIITHLGWLAVCDR